MTKIIPIEHGIQKVPESAKPWVFWYWLKGNVSKKGIKADLEAIKNAGIRGAYLMTIKGPDDPPMMKGAVTQLTSEWWEMIRYAMQQAQRLGIKLAMHDSDGFATAGGPWITPEQSMQKVVWSETSIDGNQHVNIDLDQPESYKDYYREIAVFAFPTPPGEGISTQSIKPKVTTSIKGEYAQYLVESQIEGTFNSDDPAWIQYEFDKPFTARSVTVFGGWHNYQASRLRIEVSDDGRTYHYVGQLEPPRLGWQDNGASITHAIKPTTARYFRFVYDRKGSEPGSEDMDAAKWRPELELKKLTLSGAPRINHYEGKSGEVWRIGQPTSGKSVPKSLSVPKDSIINISKHVDENGHLEWDAPHGKWTILRMGHTSTGNENSTGGGGKGLESDKFNPKAVKMQFDHWYGNVIKKMGPQLADSVLKMFHIDSWEAGSQNWSKVFREEFRKRRGYDLLPYLPVMAGIPVESADVSDRVLHDVRQTIAELINDNFFGTMADLAHEHDKTFTAESMAPTMTSDGMRHFGTVDVPMGEFWLRSPTHDKPNDMHDAISGAHIYGKPIVQAEAFTELRIQWDENPSMLKALQDRNMALGINRLVYHVFMENPWPDRKPGVTLDGIGLLFQRDQTWWEPGHAWVKYAQRCQTLLQQGQPVTDIAVFTGEDVPRRSVLPNRLIDTLPGIIGEKAVQRERKRFENYGQPMTEKPWGVTHSANIMNLRNWLDPLNGYAYDSINPDALLRLATVKNGEIVLPGGASYRLLVLPGTRRMNPIGNEMSVKVAAKLLKLVKDGATLMVSERPIQSPSLQNYPENDKKVQEIVDELWAGKPSDRSGRSMMWNLGKGRVIQAPYNAENFDPIGLKRDFIVTDSSGRHADYIAWTHRATSDSDIYFVSNQQNEERAVQISLRAAGKLPEIYNPVTNRTMSAQNWQIEDGRTNLPLKLSANGSVFIVMRKPTKSKGNCTGKNWVNLKTVGTINGSWKVNFDPEYGGPTSPVTFTKLIDWTSRTERGVKYYSGTANYSKTFNWDGSKGNRARVWLDLGNVKDIAAVRINGVDCGVAWTSPFRVDITDALEKGENTLNIAITNTWRNRLIRDHGLREEHRVTWTNAPYNLEGKPLLKSGLLGPVKIEVSGTGK